MKKTKIFFSVAVFIFLFIALALPHLTLAASGGWGTGMSTIQGFGLPNQTISNILVNLVKWLLVALGIIGIIGFVISGIMYLTSFGDDERMKTAKNAMFYSIIGVIVGLVGLVAITAIYNILQGTANF